MDTLDSSGLPVANKMPYLPSSMPDYLTHFDLHSDPFAVADFYPGAGRQSFIDGLHHQVLFGAGLLVVGAAEGVGKTRLCAQLKKSFDDVPANVCSICLQEGATLQLFVAELALMLGMSSLAAAPLGQALSELRRHLQTQREDGALSVLLIDNAHYLDEQSLSTLVGLLQGQAELDRSVCVVLFAEPNFLGRLAVADIGDLLLHDILLEAFDLDDLRAYLQWRFAQAGDNAVIPYKNSDLDAWLLESAGNLTRIHMKAQQWLMESATTASAVAVETPTLAPADAKNELKQLPVLHLGAIILLSSVLLIAYLFRADSQELTEPEVVEVLADNPAQLRSSDAVAVDIGQLPVEAKPSVVSAQTLGDVAFEVIEQPSVSEHLDALNLKGEQVSSAGATPAESEPVEAIDDRVSEEVFVEAEAKPVERELVQGPASASPLTTDEKKLLAFEEQEYVLQVMAASSRVSVAKFVAQQPNRHKMYVFASKRQGADWYVVVAGPYAGIEAARAAIGRLPSNQRSAGPWPRSLADVQLKIRENRDI